MPAIHCIDKLYMHTYMHIYTYMYAHTTWPMQAGHTAEPSTYKHCPLSPCHAASSALQLLNGLGAGPCVTFVAMFPGEPWRHAVKVPYAGKLVCSKCGIWDWRHENKSLLEKGLSKVRYTVTSPHHLA